LIKDRLKVRGSSSFRGESISLGFKPRKQSLLMELQFTEFVHNSERLCYPKETDGILHPKDSLMLGLIKYRRYLREFRIGVVFQKLLRIVAAAKSEEKENKKVKRTSRMIPQKKS
jgi:hypothetical protein